MAKKRYYNSNMASGNAQMPQERWVKTVGQPASFSASMYPDTMEADMKQIAADIAKAKKQACMKKY